GHSRRADRPHRAGHDGDRAAGRPAHGHKRRTRSVSQRARAQLWLLGVPTPYGYGRRFRSRRVRQLSDQLTVGGSGRSVAATTEKASAAPPPSDPRGERTRDGSREADAIDLRSTWGGGRARVGRRGVLG